MWDERYSETDYAYGKEPNTFLQAYANQLPKGNVLCIAEGEGRNAVFLATLGNVVTAVDSSAVGLQKASALAMENKVQINCVHTDLVEYDFGIEKWDAIVSIFCPLGATLRTKIHQQVIQGLKANGVFLLEAYRPEQLNFNTGGGPSVDTMPTKENLALELDGLAFTHLVECEREVIEGSYHTGMAAVVQAIARKPDK